MNVPTYVIKDIDEVIWHSTMLECNISLVTAMCIFCIPCKCQQNILVVGLAQVCIDVRILVVGYDAQGGAVFGKFT
jgi:hypothetical protein